MKAAKLKRTSVLSLKNARLVRFSGRLRKGVTNTAGFLACGSLLVFMVAGGCTYIGPGIYHTVSKGETLWNISKAYDVDVEKLAKANRRIHSLDQIRPGQRIFVPGARHKKNVHKCALDFIWPVRGRIIKRFGRAGNKRYLGIGISSPEGTPVYAAESGKVVFASENFRSYGKTILIEHSDEYTTVYSHNKRNFVKEGQLVKKGEKIAEVGRTGWAREPYLHFEIRYMEKPRNPVFILP